jgi:hypothetical protein
VLRRGGGISHCRVYVVSPGDGRYREPIRIILPSPSLIHLAPLSPNILPYCQIAKRDFFVCVIPKSLPPHSSSSRLSFLCVVVQIIASFPPFYSNVVVHSPQLTPFLTLIPFSLNITSDKRPTKCQSCLVLPWFMGDKGYSGGS